MHLVKHQCQQWKNSWEELQISLSNKFLLKIQIKDKALLVYQSKNYTIKTLINLKEVVIDKKNHRISILVCHL